MRGGWGLDALGKFFRRRRRRRRRPPGFGKTSRVLLWNRTSRSARIDPSSLPKHRRMNFKKSCRRKKSNIKKEWKQDQKRGKRA